MVVSGSSRIRFAIDSSGNYGYKKVGADTVTPFKNPTGTKSITSNGTYDITDYASAKISVSNSNSGTYTPTSRSSSLDMGATNSYRYVNTNSVPNSNSGTYTYASGSTGGTVDLGATNSYRYVNASNVYSKGKADGIASSGAILLWTNPSPTSAFGTSAISVDLSPYTSGYALIIAAFPTNSVASDTTKLRYTGFNSISSGGLGGVTVSATTNQYVYRRGLTVGSDLKSITFTTGNGRNMSDGGAVTGSQYLIPYKIYVIKIS